MAQRFGAAFEALQEARPVVIAAINGYAMGGGLECALSCDLRIAEEHAQMALPEPSVGLLPAGAGTQTLPWLVGEGWAKRMILTNERIDAATALRIGLVEEVVPRGQSMRKALDMALRVSTLSPRAVTCSKQLIHQARMGTPRSAALAMEREKFLDLFEGLDQQEGVNAFLEKRKPAWKTPDRNHDERRGNPVRRSQSRRLHHPEPPGCAQFSCRSEWWSNSPPCFGASRRTQPSVRCCCGGRGKKPSAPAVMSVRCTGASGSPAHCTAIFPPGIHTRLSSSFVSETVYRLDGWHHHGRRHGPRTGS